MSTAPQESNFVLRLVSGISFGFDPRVAKFWARVHADYRGESSARKVHAGASTGENGGVPARLVHDALRLWVY